MSLGLAHPGALPPIASRGDPALVARRILLGVIGLAFVALTLLDRFGLRVSDSYSISPTLIAMYTLLLAMGWTGSAQIDRRALLLVVASVSGAALSFVVNASLSEQQFSSLGSLALLIVLYLPFVFKLSPERAALLQWQRVMRGFVAFALVCAVAGIVQFYAQFVYNPPWLFDFRELIPPAIRGSGVYNTINPVGTLIKSNGFFLREASGFSFLMAFALICEFSLWRRKLPMAVLALAMVLSYSGSGLLALGAALLVPFSLRTVMRIVAVALVLAVVVFLFGDALNLSYTLNRVGEFDSTHSSAYCRFVAPAQLLVDRIDSEPWTMWIGHGPGTTQKLSDICETTYGKLAFEYGVTGFVCFSLLILDAIGRHAAPLRVRVALIVQWYLLGGFLLAPEALLLVYVLCAMWPAIDPIKPNRETRPGVRST